MTEFRPLQQRIAMALESDEKICDPSRVLRVAGFWHQKDEPFLTNICHIGDYYTASQVRKFVLSLMPKTKTEPDTPQVSQEYKTSHTLHLGEMPEHIKQAKQKHFCGMHYTHHTLMRLILRLHYLLFLMMIEMSG